MLVNYINAAAPQSSMSDTDFMERLIAFCQEQGYIWGPSPEIYGGLSGFYEYAPLGKLLKNNVENAIRKVFQQHRFWEVECPTVMPEAVWKASGHLENFTDPLIEDKKGNLHRADKLIEEQLRTKGFVPEEIMKSTAAEHLLGIIDKHGITAPDGSALQREITYHNLMMQTVIGRDAQAYNRPETATTTYLPFQRYFDHFRKKLPFGVFQIGKAYRNEISPRQFTLRMREFTQAEAQLFLFADQKNAFQLYEAVKDAVLPFWHAAQQSSGNEPVRCSVSDARAKGWLKNDAYAYTLAVTYQLFRSLGLPDKSLRLRQHGPDEKAFYADDAWDVEVELQSFGWTELCGVHDRTDYDLTQHQKHSKKSLTASDETHKKEVPHIIEIAFGTDRVLFSILDHSFDPKAEAEGKTCLRVSAALAPIRVAVFPLVKKDGMPELAQEIEQELARHVVTTYDASGSIGRRYLRASQQAIPWCVTVDGQTLKDGTVTLRDRDTEEQVRVSRNELLTHLS